jgi:hypothetical protein
VEHFSSLDHLNKWLNEEKTRPYWNNSYIEEIVEIQNPIILDTYKEKRLKEYPPYYEYIEAAYEKYELNNSDKMRIYDEKVKSIKSKYPVG